MNNAVNAIILNKTPGEYYNETIDWSCATRGLGDDTIASSTWSFTGKDAALVLADSAIGDPAVTTSIFISLGTAGYVYTITNEITTTGGQVLSETFIMSVNAFNFIGVPSSL